jgi:hypothetical protein
MTITHYPDSKSRKDKQPAGKFKGAKWAEAPGAGNWYCLPDGIPASTDTMIIATTRAGESFYVGALPEGVTYA